MNDIEQSESLDYMLTYSDREIINIIVNPKKWTEKEIELAKTIIEQRGLTVELQNALEKKDISRNEKFVKRRANIFLVIVIIWILNFYIGREAEFLLGFGIEILLNRLFTTVTFFHSLGNVFKICMVFTLFPALYIWIWYQSKRLNKTIYLTGLIVYCFDTIYFAIYKIMNGDLFWTLIVITLRLIILLLLYRGYKALLKK